ncbi:protein kinase domain-containing protein [Actinoallomurus sp. CA-150999]|uniref:WD40 repeat domain-containing serine/threonine protein kinase n=1 Tax=Actinoallomurus sp. CA-150999 TaxID=3239887 RepID=UPI003D8B0FF0
MVDGTPDDEQELINGRYRLVEAIGQGGMGTVWRGHDEMLDREVAIKRVLFPPDVDDDERAELTALALREARATARLNHPGVVTIHDVIDDGSPVIVMELIEGRSLADIVREEVRLPYRRVAEIGAAVLDALREAHTAGIVHRDLKPANILITDRRIVLTDFGVAQRVGERADDFEDVLGTPAFMAPEQVEGAAASPAADLWSLGAVLFNAVEGKPPFEGPDHATVLLTLLTQEAPALVNGGPLKPLIAALLIKDPQRRPTAEETAERLEAVLNQDDGSASPVQGRPVIAAPDTGKGAGRPDPGRSAPPPPSVAKPTSPGPGAPASGPKPATGPVSLPPRPHRVRSAPPAPHHLPARSPSPDAQRFKRAVAGPVVAALFLLGLYLFTHISSGGSASSGVNPIPSDSFGGLPSVPVYTPPTSPEPTPTTSEKPSGFQKATISQDGDTVAFGGESAEIRVYDTASRKLRWRFRASPNSYGDTYALALSPDGQTLAVATEEGAGLWDLRGHKKRKIDDFGDAVGTLQFSADGRTLSALGMSGKFGSWNAGTGTYTAGGAITLPNNEDVCDTALSANGRYAACGYSAFGNNDDDGIIVWDIENNHQVAAWPGSSWEYGLALSPDGKKVIFSEEDTHLQIWDVASHRQTGSLAVNGSSVINARAFSQDGSRLAVPDPDTDGVIEIWNVTKEQKVMRLKGAVGGPSAMEFSADGDRLVAADGHNGVVWNARSGTKLASWTG